MYVKHVRMMKSREECNRTIQIKEHYKAISPFALGVCGRSYLHDIIFFLLVSLLENKISLGASKPNYWLR